MRIVYDDTMQNEFVVAVKICLNELNVKDVLKYEYGTERVQMGTVKTMLNKLLQKNLHMEIGETIVHAHGIGNNCKYPVYYHGASNDEIQQCAYINLNTGMYGEGYLSCEDYNGKKLGAIYELSKWGIKVI